MIEHILPTPIFIAPIELSSKNDLVDWVDKASADNVNYNGYYTDNQLHKRPEFAELVSIVLQKTNQYIKELRHRTKDGSPYRLAVTRMWATQFSENNRVVRHCHSGQGAIISGVYYLSLPKDVSSGIEFIPRNIPFLENIPFEHGFSDAVDIGEDILLLFPAEIIHCGIGNPSKSKRMNISFDITYCDNLYGPII